MSEADINRRLDEAAAIVRAAHETLAAGRPVSLDRLAEVVDGACAALARLPAEKAQSFKTRLVALYDDLDKLAAATAREYEQLKKSLGDLDAHSRAHAAYGKTPRDGD